jgi:hypothetical protein
MVTYLSLCVGEVKVTFCVHVKSISNVNSNADSDTLTVHKGEVLNGDVLVFMCGGSEGNILCAC